MYCTVHQENKFKNRIFFLAMSKNPPFVCGACSTHFKLNSTDCLIIFCPNYAYVVIFKCFVVEQVPESFLHEASRMWICYPGWGDSNTRKSLQLDFVTVIIFRKWGLTSTLIQSIGPTISWKNKSSFIRRMRIFSYRIRNSYAKRFTFKPKNFSVQQKLLYEKSW